MVASWSLAQRVPLQIPAVGGAFWDETPRAIEVLTGDRLTLAMRHGRPQVAMDPAGAGCRRSPPSRLWRRRRYRSRRRCATSLLGRMFQTPGSP
jgi:hypothetical protein